MDPVKQKQFEILQKSIDSQKQPILARIKPIRNELLQFMYDNYIEDFQEFDRYCRYNHYTYNQAISTNKSHITEEQISQSTIAQSLETNQRILSYEIMRFNALKSMKNKSKKENKIEEKKSSQSIENNFIPEPPKYRVTRKGMMIIQVKEEDYYQSNFYRNERQNNQIFGKKSVLPIQLKKSIPQKKLYEIFEQFQEEKQLIEEEALSTIQFD